MDQHTITIPELNEFLKTEEVDFAFSFGKKSNKRLTISFDGTLNIYNDGVIVLKTKSKAAAIRKYNYLP